MKKAIKFLSYRFGLLCSFMLAATYSFAADDANRSVYDVTTTPRHHIEMYSGFFPYLIFGVVIVFLGYVSYRYWKDNQPEDDMHHTPHHQ